MTVKTTRISRPAATTQLLSPEAQRAGRIAAASLVMLLVLVAIVLDLRERAQARQQVEPVKYVLVVATPTLQAPAPTSAPAAVVAPATAAPAQVEQAVDAPVSVEAAPPTLAPALLDELTYDSTHQKQTDEPGPRAAIQTEQAAGQTCWQGPPLANPEQLDRCWQGVPFVQP